MDYLLLTNSINADLILSKSLQYRWIELSITTIISLISSIVKFFILSIFNYTLIYESTITHQIPPLWEHLAKDNGYEALCFYCGRYGIEPYCMTCPCLLGRPRVCSPVIFWTPKPRFHYVVGVNLGFNLFIQYYLRLLPPPLTQLIL